MRHPVLSLRLGGFGAVRRNHLFRGKFGGGPCLSPCSITPLEIKSNAHSVNACRRCLGVDLCDTLYGMSVARASCCRLRRVLIECRDRFGNLGHMLCKGSLNRPSNHISALHDPISKQITPTLSTCLGLSSRNRQWRDDPETHSEPIFVVCA